MYEHKMENDKNRISEEILNWNPQGRKNAKTEEKSWTKNYRFEEKLNRSVMTRGDSSNNPSRLMILQNKM